ncbi:iron-containing alcohol dehydrogenase [Helcococcus kunzii]|uniref:iron-containing alcohol dehydrogenase n=1 Tax=Helcococcus kunzii TaxID=40091 RepID=UPI0021A5B097|nr:iron-containing alcohol dehydrogenase [Helcococcus kunzii]MCT1796073.1 iron-containing alcohol dehydrogenase [Helcococcus kunzii]MCT1989768.1 iron-containing alcohol dehydrogenase [Helcococcus kunzii]
MEFVLPAINKFGKDSYQEISNTLLKENKKKGLIITTKDIYELGLLKDILNILEENQIQYEMYTGVVPNPTINNVEDSSKLFLDNKCDFIMGVGGGSANDCAKAVGILVSNGGNIKEYVGFNKSRHKSPFLICVNTTAGTASEISRAFLINDEENKEKLIFKDINALPDLSINNPEIMFGLPKKITAQTGMDALTHAIESYISTGAYTLTKEFSLSAIKLIFNSLEKVIDEPKNENLRNEMIYAQFLAGMAFCNAGLGLVHAMSHQLSALYNLPHGLSNAILLPEVMRLNKKISTKGFAEIYQNIFLDSFEDDEKSADLLIERVENLSDKVGTKVKLSDLGVLEEDIDKLIDMTFKDGNLPRNPYQPTKEDVKNIFKKVM